jgi:glycosyltransferase involved in cell wall biosynthesis
MMHSLGHEVYLYAGYQNEAACTEHIVIMDEAHHKKWWGDNDYTKDFFAIQWDSKLSYWQHANNNAIAEIKKRIQPRDFICLIGGVCQKPIADAFPQHMAVEFGIGYEGVFSAYRVFESYAWMHYLYGKLNQNDGSSYDAVIPNYFDPTDFPLTTRNQKSDYFAYMGRLVRRKGIELAVETTRRLGKKLKIAGQGVIDYRPGYIKAAELTIEGDHIEYVGVLGVKERAEFMGKARALFVPTTYIGPWEGVHVESLFCGTPVITSDWGVFSSTVPDGQVGYRVRTLGEAMWAVRNVDKLWGPMHLREYARNRFSLDVVKYQYQEYFERLMTLWGDGWYDTNFTGFIKREAGGFV